MNGEPPDRRENRRKRRKNARTITKRHRKYYDGTRDG